MFAKTKCKITSIAIKIFMKVSPLEQKHKYE